MSLSAARIKEIKSLGRKKFRQTYHKFVVEGPKQVAELLGTHSYPLERIYALPHWDNPGFDEACIERINARELSRISQLTTPHQVLAVCGLPQVADMDHSATFHRLERGWHLYLDGIQSPANLGAILRVVDWFGGRTVVFGAGTADLYNPKSIQASMGSFLRIDCPRLELSQIKSRMPDLPIYGADMGGQSIFDFQRPAAGLLVIGQEGAGIRPHTRELVDHWLSIPKAATSGAESLNAAVAAGIFCSVLRA